MTLGSLLVAIGLATAPQPADTLVSADSAMTLLRNGGFTIMWRHAQTDRSVSDVPGQQTERYQQRNLNDLGVATAKAVGVIFKTRGIPIGEVLSSPMYRTMETAQYAFGRATPTALLRTLEASGEERALILRPPAPGSNRVLVTHHFIIERNAPGIRPGDVGEGEAAIVKSDGKSLTTVAIIKIADWKRLAPVATDARTTAESYPAPQFALAGASPELGAMIHSPRGHVALSYVQSFNAGRDAMQAFLENYAMPDPSRTIEQRLQAYDQLRRDFGGFGTITGVEVIAAGELRIRARMTTGSEVTIAFKQETQSPYRATSIGFQKAHGG